MKSAVMAVTAFLILNQIRGISVERGTSLFGLLGMSAPFHSPLMQISLNFAAGVLLYSRFQESIIILLGGSSARGSLGFATGLGASSWDDAADLGAAPPWGGVLGVAWALLLDFSFGASFLLSFGGAAFFSFYFFLMPILTKYYCHVLFCRADIFRTSCLLRKPRSSAC